VGDELREQVERALGELTIERSAPPSAVARSTRSKAGRASTSAR
jgi:hypothetical protein